MAQTLQIDTNGDLVVTGGNLTFLTGAAAVGQDCLTAMRSQLGEMQYEMQNGMPYRQHVFNNQFNPAGFEAAARRVIGGVTGVDKITQFLMDVTDNTLSYVAEIETIYGPTFING